ncbi:hypothetical protein [Mycobacterium gordonae]|uniref:Uncharacterized protein n=1 Tax=Mycobacterium gordonae TaxID=1778 RepID=A0A1X1WPP9_MYCGO|nr:hypothetical protein [Mycobacterium gordonae]MCV7004596.1 hypothetical protein [Mycobacterium gordonae]ODR14291.1 hypothetical protein BHQ23_33215 [Mycobacterium gordonae]ORV88518.1 hypothetical protein AWC08_22270 [Mycobacterium gordonae]
MPDNNDEWTVHVLGPDDIMPATDYADAVRQANEINKVVEDGLPIHTEYHPIVWAVPVPKGRYAYPLAPGETC